MRWRVAGFFFISGIITATWNSRIPDVQDHLQLGDAAWGVVLSALPLGLIVGLPVSSWLVARFGTAAVTTITSIIACLGLALLGSVDERVPVMIVLFFIGFNRTIMNIAINASAVEVRQWYEKPIVSVFHGLWSLACFVAAGIGTLMIIMKIIPAYHFLLIAILCAVGVLLNRDRTKAMSESAVGRKPFLVKPTRYLFLLGVIAFFSMSAENTMFDWSINYFDRTLHTERKWMTAGYTCFIVMMSLGRLAGDRMIHRFGYINMLQFNGILMAAGFAIASGLPDLWSACFGFLLVGFGDATVVPIIYSLAGKSKMLPAYAIASVTTIGYAGFVVNPLIVGFISDKIGMQWAFGLMGLYAVCVTLLAGRVKKVQPSNGQ